MQKHSIHFQQIEQWFQCAQAPYGVKDIYAFNALYRRTYNHLTREEKRRVEDEIVSTMIDGVEYPDLKAKIYGVV